jgi:hypothetical protein
MPPIRHRLVNPLVGFCLHSANNLGGNHGDKMVEILPQGFFTSDDGPVLYTYLDNLFSALGDAFNRARVRPEVIDNCLINIVDGTDATIWVNFPTILQTVTKEAINAGDAATLNNLADVRSASFAGVEMPARGAVAYTFQHGWRRGLYFDFSMLPGEPNRNLADFPSLLGSLHTALIFRERIQMKPDVLARMFETGWFPFIRLPHDLAIGLYRHFEEAWDHTPLEDEIVKVLGPMVPALLDGWSRKAAFAPHMGAIGDAVRLYSNGEYSAAANMLLPKVEGILRTLNMGRGPRPSARALRENLLARVRAQVTGITAFLPEAFVQYLEAFYYAGFDLDANELPPSRHAFMHGVGPDAELAKPAYAMKLLLCLDQLFFYV